MQGYSVLCNIVLLFFGAKKYSSIFLWHKEKFVIHSFLWCKENFSVTLFFGAKKRDKRNIHPHPSFPYMGRLNRFSRRSFIKVSSPHQRGGLIICRLTPVPLCWCPCIVALVSVVLCWCSSAGVLAPNLMDFCSLLPIIIVMIYSESETLILDAAE